MVFFTMYLLEPEIDDADKKEILRERLRQLVFEVEAIKDNAVKRLQCLENMTEQRLKELENKLSIIEERFWLLSQLLASMSPDKRIN